MMLTSILNSFLSEYIKEFVSYTGLYSICGRGSFGHGSIGHHQPQQPVPRGFPLFKRCEWLVSKWRPPLFVI